MLPFNSKDIKEFVDNWNRVLPIDRWYRKKYNIPFNSSSHKEIGLIDMFVDFWEFIITQPKNKKEQQEAYIKGSGNFMKDIIVRPKDIDTLFDEIDIDNMD